MYVELQGFALGWKYNSNVRACCQAHQRLHAGGAPDGSDAAADQRDVARPRENVRAVRRDWPQQAHLPPELCCPGVLPTP